MRRRILLLLLMSSLVLPSVRSLKAEDSFAILNGETYTYEVITSDVYAKIGCKKFSASTFQLDDLSCSLENTVQVSVTDTHEQDMNYTLTCQTASENYSMHDDFLMYYAFFNYYFGYVYNIAGSIYHDYSINNDFSSMSLSYGLKINRVPFFIAVNESNWNLIENLASSLNDSTYYTDSNELLTATAIFDDSDEVLFFECWISGSFEHDTHTGRISNDFSVAYNKSNGVLLGLRTKGSFKGKFEGKSVTCTTNFHIEQINYDLKELSLYSALSPISNIVLIASIALPLVMIGRKRRKEC